MTTCFGHRMTILRSTRAIIYTFLLCIDMVLVVSSADLNTPHGTTLPQYRTSKTTRSDERNKHRSLQQIQLTHQGPMK